MSRTHAGFEWVLAVEPQRGSGQDRAAVFERDGLVLALADGAGGTSHGADAARAVIDAVATRDADWCDVLRAVDASLGVGSTTAIVLVVDGRSVCGASVGDSQAWLVTGDGIVRLTEHQQRKPFLGDGCEPVEIERVAIDGGTIVIGSDGLFNYAPASEIARLAVMPDLDAAARALIDRVRLPNGELQDDVSVILCRAV